MSSREGAGQRIAADITSHIVLVVRDSAQPIDVAAILEQRGYHVTRARDPLGALARVRETWPDLVVVEGDGADLDDSLGEALRSRQVPVLAIVESVPDPDAWYDRFGDVADWVLYANVRTELPARATRLLRARRQAATPQGLPADAHFLALVIHDLRTPLNVIGLSLRMIGQTVPKGDPDLDEDLRFVEENFKQIERMLAQLSDYFRLFEADEPPYLSEFSPQTLLGEVLENRAVKQGPKGALVRVEVAPTCPRSVYLDQARSRLALQHAITNALAAAGEGTVVVALRGDSERWITEIRIDRAPPASVQSTPLRSHVFERLCGTAAERRGMDLAIAARITELFHGSARLDVVPDRSTTLVLEWPERLPAVQR